MRLAQSELKGMLIKNMERGTFDSKNLYHKKLYEGSQVFQQIQAESVKEKPRRKESNSLKLSESLSKSKMSSKRSLSKDVAVFLTNEIEPEEEVKVIHYID